MIFAGGVFAVLVAIVIVTVIICSKKRKLRKGTVIINLCTAYAQYVTKLHGWP